MSEEPKPCPFCGGPAELQQTDGEDEDGEIWFHCEVKCSNQACRVVCFTDILSSNSQSDFDVKKLAIEAWNTRVEDK